MARALFLGLPLHGHTNPSLPLVRALVERGEEVVYFSTDAFAPQIQRAGAHFRPYGAACLTDLSSLGARPYAISSFLMRATSEVLAQHLDEFRRERPDYIITDSVAPWGQWAAELMDVPAVTSVTTFAVNRHVMRFAAAQGTRPKSARVFASKLQHLVKAVRLRRRLRRKYRVSGTSIMGLMFGSSDLNIVYTSREFQPRAETFDDTFLFVGPSVGARTEVDASASEEWVPVKPAAKVIYISLGTLFNADEAFYRACFAAFGDTHHNVVMSIGAAVSAARLGPAPANIEVRPWVAQLSVLRHTSVFVSHGGMNSVGESLQNGVPLVVVPQMGEQELVAGQVERLGAGLHVAKERATAERLRQAVDRVLADSTYRERATCLGRSFEAAGGAARGANAILAFTRGRIRDHATGSRASAR
jgi:MGT family glycosyltransferase